MNRINRFSNFELFRVVTMFLIVCHHYVVNSGLLGYVSTDPLAPASVFYYIFGMWGKTGINCFILLTGYFMCEKQISLYKFAKLYLWVIFYGVLINMIFILSGRLSFTPGLLWTLFPFRHINSNSFVSSFFLWWLGIPFLNALIQNITKRQHQLLVVYSTVLFMVWPFIPGLEISVNPICWFSTLYAIASYIKRYPDDAPFSWSKKQWGVCLVISVVLSMLSVVAILLVNGRLGLEIDPYKFVSDSNAPLALVVSICAFMYFSNINMKTVSLVNSLGATSFGVLLIHANSDTMRQWLWKDVIDCVGHYDTPFYYLYAIVVCLAIYFVCSLIDWVRLRWLEPVYMRPFIRK